MATSRDDVRVRIGGDAGPLSRDLREAQKLIDQFATRGQASLRRMDSGFGGLTRTFGTLNSAIGAFGVTLSAGALVNAIGSAVSAAAELGDLAQRLGVSVESLQAWRYAASQSGASARDLDQGLAQLTRRIGDFRATGTGPAAESLRRLGLDNDVLSGKLHGTEAIFRAVAARMGEITDANERASIAAGLLGQEAGPRLASMLGQGAEGLARQEAAARRLGLVLTKEVIEKAREFKDDWTAAVNYVVAHFQAGTLNMLTAIQGFFKNLAETPDRLRAVSDEQRRLGVEIQATTTQLDSQERTLRRLLELQERQTARGEEPDARRAEVIADLTEKAGALRAQLGDLRAAYDRLIEGQQAAAAAAQKETAATVAAADAGKAKALIDHEREAAEKAAAEATKLAEQEMENERKLQDEINKLVNESVDKRGELSDRYRDQIEDNERLIAAMEISQTAYEQEKALLEIINAHKQQNIWLTDEEIEQYRVLAERLGKQRERMDQLDKAAESSKRTARDLGLTFTSAFEDAVVSGAELSDVLRGIEQDLLRIAVRRTITEPFADAIGGIDFGGMLRGIFSARGNAFAAGRVLPFAKGGLIPSPIVFPLANGIGLAGEAGPEGILPLRRNRAGRLGVEAQGAGAAPINIYNYASNTAVSAERDDRSGRVDIVIDEMVAKTVRPGTRTFRALTGAFEGLAPRTTRR